MGPSVVVAQILTEDAFGVKIVENDEVVEASQLAGGAVLSRERVFFPHSADQGSAVRIDVDFASPEDLDSPAGCVAKSTETA
jgi:hypothetical protein